MALQTNTITEADIASSAVPISPDQPVSVSSSGGVGTITLQRSLNGTVWDDVDTIVNTGSRNYTPKVPEMFRIYSTVYTSGTFTVLVKRPNK